MDECWWGFIIREKRAQEYLEDMLNRKITRDGKLAICDLNLH